MPRFEVTSPDGKKYEVTGPDGSTHEEAIAQVQAQLSAAPQPRVPTDGPKSLVDHIASAVNSVSEPIVSMATGTAGQVLGGLAGGAAALTPGLRPGIGRDVSEKVANALTYQPRSEGGKAVLSTIAKPFEWLASKAGQAGQATLDATGSPLAATAVDTGIQALPMALGPATRALGLGAPESAASVAARNAAKSRNSVKDSTIAAARDEGYVVPPSTVEGSFLGNKLESIAGKAAIEQRAAIKNQPVTDRIARREAGLKDDSPITEKTLSDARDVMAQPYRDVAAVSNIAASALEKLKQARSDAKVYWRHYDMSGTPESLTKAKALDARAQLLENVIDKEAAGSGKPGLLNELRDARVAIAKNHTVERALNLGSGEVDANLIGRLLDKGVPLTGGLETIGNFAQAFGKSAREGSKVPTPGVSKIGPMAAAALGIGGHAALGPPGLLAAALPLMDAPARALMLSRMMQKPRTYNPSTMTNIKSQPGGPGVLSGIAGAGTANNQDNAALLRFLRGSSQQ